MACNKCFKTILNPVTTITFGFWRLFKMQPVSPKLHIRFGESPTSTSFRTDVGFEKSLTPTLFGPSTRDTDEASGFLRLSGCLGPRKLSRYSDSLRAGRVRGSNPGGGWGIFRTRPDRPWIPPSLLYNGYRVFPVDKAAGPWS